MKRNYKIITTISLLFMALWFLSAGFYNIPGLIMAQANPKSTISTNVLKPIWQTNGIPVYAASEFHQDPQVCCDENGNSIIIWRLNGLDDLFAQKISPSGNLLWNPSGVTICAYPASSVSNAKICCDGQGGAIVVWEDSLRNPGMNIYAQRINSDGTVNWTTNGIVIVDVNGVGYDHYNPQICSDGIGGAIISWYGKYLGDSDNQIYAQRVDSSGTLQWGAKVVICNRSTDQNNQRMCYDGDGNATIVWADSRAGNVDIYAQKVDLNGVTKWGDGTPGDFNGTVVCSNTQNQANPKICCSNNGKVVIAWEDYRAGGGVRDIYAQLLNHTGDIQWTANGVGICTAGNDQYNSELCCDSEGNALIVWEDTRSTTKDIYAQKINQTQAIQWTPNGIAICAETSADQRDPVLCSDGAGGAYVAWEDGRNGVNYDIYAQYVNSSGTQWGSGGAVCDRFNNQFDVAICRNATGGAVVVWEDYRTGYWNNYAQMIIDGPSQQTQGPPLPLALALGMQQPSDLILPIAIIGVVAGVVAIVVILIKRR